MKSIKLKWVTLYLALVFIIMIISGTFMLTQTKRLESDKARASLKKHITKIEEQVVRGYDEAWFNDAINEVHFENNAHIESNILNIRGATIASTVSLSAQYEDTSILSAFNNIESFTSGQDLDSATGQYRQWFNYAYPVTGDEGSVVYVIFARMDAQSMYDSLLQQSITLMFTLILALGMTALMGFLFANTLTEPIILLTKKSKEIANGQLDQEIEVKSKDEIGQLAESFNYMVKELQKSISAITSEKNKIEIIQHNMSDGVLAYDNAGALIHANFAAQDMLGLVNIETIPYHEMMERLKADIPEPGELTDDDIRDTSLELGDRFINASFTPYFNRYGHAEGLVIVLQDITRHKKLDDMRKEFVANVSHEIRTPLTTVKSYTETLLNNDEREHEQEFLEIINSEADRMALLVQDLLELTRFDSQQLKLEFQNVELDTLINRSVRQNSILAEQKSQRISYIPPAAKYKLVCDPYRINQVFNNIISNAVKYSAHGSAIMITADETAVYYQVRISDQGIGIPKADLPRIFERFYRVDKARSRAMGGTGLGLAIAKEIMDAHKGNILAVSETGAGTTMTVQFPKIIKGEEQ